MSSTVAPGLRDRVRTITDALEAFDGVRVIAGSDPGITFDQSGIESYLDRLCVSFLPADEAFGRVVYNACTDTDRKWFCSRVRWLKWSMRTCQ